MRRADATLEFRYPGQLVPSLVIFGDLVDPEFEFLERIAPTDAPCIDVGAAIGQFSVFAGRAGWKVHAVEPSTANVEMLRRNLQRNRLDERVEVHHLALSTEPGEASFATAETTYLSRLDVEPGGETEVVEVDTLDHFVDRLGLERVSVLKVNVAGYEPEVLAGGAAVLADGRVDVLVLLIGWASLPVYLQLSRQGYGFYYFDRATSELRQVVRFDNVGFVEDRPEEARHILGIREEALAGLVDGRMAVRRA